MTIGRGVEDEAGFRRSSVALLCCTGASSIDRSGSTESDRSLGDI